MTRIWIHTIICCESPFLRELEMSWQNAKADIIRESLKNDIVINCIDGTATHLHCIISLGDKQSTHKTVQKLKAITTENFQKYRLANEGFEWLEEYMAFSVSDLLLDLEKHCILTQKKYHEKKPLKEELLQILNECKYSYE